MVWHQEFRKFLTSSANFITDDILQLRSNSLIAQNSRLFFSFIVSGFIHFLMDLARGIPPKESGSMTHFIVLALGIMVEDLLTYVGGLMFDSQPKRWKRALGYIWVSLFFFFAVPVYWYPICRRMQQTGERVPRF